jgi:hypothetical protein
MIPRIPRSPHDKPVWLPGTAWGPDDITIHSDDNKLRISTAIYARYTLVGWIDTYFDSSEVYEGVQDEWRKPFAEAQMDRDEVLRLERKAQARSPELQAAIQAKLEELEHAKDQLVALAKSKRKPGLFRRCFRKIKKCFERK